MLQTVRLQTTDNFILDWYSIRLRYQKVNKAPISFLTQKSGSPGAFATHFKFKTEMGVISCRMALKCSNSSIKAGILKMQNYAERRLALGVEIILTDPPAYFAHRKNAVSGMASFDIAKNTLTSIGLDCPIWLIGIGE